MQPEQWVASSSSIGSSSRTAVAVMFHLVVVVQVCKIEVDVQNGSLDYFGLEAGIIASARSWKFFVAGGLPRSYAVATITHYNALS